jgi:hypothetical protein
VSVGPFPPEVRFWGMLRLMFRKLGYGMDVTSFTFGCSYIIVSLLLNKNGGEALFFY